MEEKAYKGVWFLPNEPAKKIHGTLTINGKKYFHLDLVGTLPGRHELNKSIDIILGYTSDGTKFTLLDNNISNYRFSSPGFSTVSFSPSKIISGYHFSIRSDLQFKNISLKIKSLDNWLGIFGFKPISIDSNKPGSIAISYDLPKKIEFEFSDTIRGEFNFFVHTRFNNVVEEMKIVQTSSTSLFSDSYLSFSEWLDIIFAFQSFLALAFFDYPEIEEISSTIYKSTEEDEQQSEIKILLRTKNISENKNDFLFTYLDIQNKESIIFKNWFSLFNNIKPVIGGLIQSFSRDNKVQEFNFLNTAQCVETLHRRLRKNNVLKKEDFDEKIKKIINSVPESDQDWLKEKLLYSNEPTLFNRLCDVISELPNSLKVKLFENEIEFAKSIKDTRNYYTHYSKNLQKKALKGVELFKATERLKVLLVTFLLKELKLLDEKSEQEFLLRAGRFFYYTYMGFS